MRRTERKDERGNGTMVSWCKCGRNVEDNNGKRDVEGTRSLTFR